jgi:hypothetical protein
MPPYFAFSLQQTGRAHPMLSAQLSGRKASLLLLDPAPLGKLLRNRLPGSE